MDLTIPHQLFIDNEFVDSSDSKTFKTINPANEEVNLSYTYTQAHLDFVKTFTCFSKKKENLF